MDLEDQVIKPGAPKIQDIGEPNPTEDDAVKNMQEEYQVNAEVKVVQRFDVEIKEIPREPTEQSIRLIETLLDPHKNELKGSNNTHIIASKTNNKDPGLEVIEMNTNWQPLNPAFSQTKPLPFSQGPRSQEFWSTVIANEAQDLFKSLMPKKLVLAVCHQLNTQLRKMFSGQMDEKNLRKKLYKPEQLYEYFGVKILMGYCRMPDPEDYFNQSLPFRNRIGDLIKEGRFKCVESWTQFNDDMLDALKQQRQSKTEYKDKSHLDCLVIPRIMKKITKIQQRACSTQQPLVITRNQYFESVDQGDQITCLQLQDATTNFILNMSFLKKKQDIEVITMRMLEHYKQRNHKVYLQRHLLQLDQINHLSVCSGLYCSGIVKNTDVRFSKGELMSNGTLMVLQLRQKDSQNILVSSADGFHRYSATDKRSYATVMLQDTLKKSEQPLLLNDQYKCQFSCITQSGALFTEVVEMITWNSYCAYKSILMKNCEYLDFRLLLAKQLLASKIKPIESTPQPSLPLPHAKTNCVGVQTEKLSSFSSFQPKAPISSFHIPTMLVVPTNFTVSLVCLVCRRNHSQLTQCANCSEVSGKLVALCPTECFSLFHQQPTEYISQADDLPSLPPATQKAVHQAQFEQSSLAQSATYQQSVYNRYNSIGSQGRQVGFTQQNQIPKPPSKPGQQYYQLDDTAYEMPNPQQQSQMADLMDEDDLWDDGKEQLRRRPGRPKGAKNRAQRLVAPEEGAVTQPQQNGPQSYYDFEEERPQVSNNNKNGKKQVSYNFVGPQD